MTTHNQDDHDRETAEDNKDKDNIVSLADIRKAEREAREKDDAEYFAKMRKTQHAPMINLPPFTKLLIIINCALFGLILIGGMGWKVWSFSHFAFVPARFGLYIESMRPLDLITPITYQFLHNGWLHIGVNMAMLAAFGSGLEKMWGAKRFFIYYLICGILGAVGHLIVEPGSGAPVVGASGAISGLFSAIIVIYARRGMLPMGQYGLWPFILIWCVISYLFALAGGASFGSIAWAAHLGGFLGGFALMRLKYFNVV